MLRIGSIVLGVSDIERAKKFWMAAIDYEPRDLADSRASPFAPRSLCR